MGKITTGKEVISGVYKLTCIPNGKVYIGMSIDIHKRWYRHQCKLLKPGLKFSQRGLQDDMIMYGAKSFTLEVLEVCDDKDERRELEVYHINLHRSYDRKYGYNRLGYELITDENERYKHWK